METSKGYCECREGKRSSSRQDQGQKKEQEQEKEKEQGQGQDLIPHKREANQGTGLAEDLLLGVIEGGDGNAVDLLEDVALVDVRESMIGRTVRNDLRRGEKRKGKCKANG
eukprot:752133-Hanusia_phi.AAC.3